MAENATSILTATPAAPNPGAAGQPGAGNGSLPGGEAGNAPWFDEIIANEKDAEFANYVKGKNYPTPRDALYGHYSAERMVGLDKAGRTVVLPKDDKDVEGTKAFYVKIGVPETPEGYKLPLPQGDDGIFAKAASGAFHKFGVPAKAAEGIATWWNEYIATEVQKAEAADQAASVQQLEALKGEWGQAFDTKAEFGRRGLRAVGKEAGLDDRDLKKLEATLGTAKMLKMFSKIGEGAGESAFAGGEGGGSGSNFRISPEAAQQQIDAFRKDRAENKINDYTWKTEIEPQVLKLMEIASGVK